MYYAFNYLSYFFTLVAIGAVYEKNAPSWVILMLLFTAMCFHLVASVWVVEKCDDLESRIKKLENKKDKNNES